MIKTLGPLFALNLACVACSTETLRAPSEGALDAAAIDATAVDAPEQPDASWTQPHDGRFSMGSDAPAPGMPVAEAGPRTYAPTYTAVWNEILLPSCAWLYCHGGAGLHLILESKQGGYQSLLGPAEGFHCAPTGLRRVEPGQPDRSLAVLKLDENPPCGERMPIALLSAPLAAMDVEQFRAWVALGAPDN